MAHGLSGYSCPSRQLDHQPHHLLPTMTSVIPLVLGPVLELTPRHSSHSNVYTLPMP
jgi:hypothetical protein